MKNNRKSILLSLITLSLQLGNSNINAEGIIGNNVVVDDTNNYPIVNINSPVNGLSYNKYTDFSTDKGVILNNSPYAVNTQLAGQIAGNTNLQKSADIIVNEVIGTNVSKLNGTLEVAGQQADVIIANPNGITVDNLKFINTDRAVLTTGTPNIINGRLNDISVAKGEITINGNLNEPIIEDEKILHNSINRVDILAKAVHINAEIFAQDKINVVTGNNNINYQDDTIKKSSKNENTKTGISLDVAALGGMYANTISLVGTEKGLGVNLGGNVDAIAGDLHIDTAGNLTIQTHKIGEDDTTIHAGKKVDIVSQDFTNNGNTIAEDGVKINSNNFSNNAKLQGEKLEINAKNIDGIGVISANDDVQMKSTNKINYDGAINSTKGTVTLAAKQVKVDKDNISVSSKDKLKILEAEPMPKKEEVSTPPSKKPIVVSENPSLNAIENLPNHAVMVKDKKDLALTVDTNANKNYQPIIDKTRNGIDLVNIAQVNGQGVSLNKYVDFNVKARGLVLNNATKYTNTKLAGYIDKNMFLAGRGAKTIINEVTSTNKSSLNGFIEVAGNPADVVIVNPNGMVVNGLGFINSKNIELDSLQNIDILGKGFNGNNLENIKINTTNFSNNNSELWGKNLYVNASAAMNNTGKIGIENLLVNTKAFDNAGFIESKNNADITTSDLAQEQGTIKASGELNLKANKLNNINKSLIEADKKVIINSNELSNTNSNIVSNGELSLKVNTIKNSNDGVIATKDKLQIIGKDLTNEKSNIISKGNGNIQLTEKLNNRNKGLISIDGNSNLTVNTFTNDNSKILLNGENSLVSKDFSNQNNGYMKFSKNTNLKGNNFTNINSILVSSGNLDVNLTKAFTNEDSLLIGNKNVGITADNVINTNKSGEYYGSEINVAGNFDVNARESLDNRSSDITTKGNINIKAPKINNHKEKFISDWVVTEADKIEKIPHLDQPNYYDADRKYHRIIHTGKIQEETADARIISDSNINIKSNEISNMYSQIMAGKDLDIVANNLENIGYQGTIHFDDLGRDRHYWKFKKKRRWWHRKKWVYGHTDLPYENHQVFDEEPSLNSERIAVLSSNGKTTIKADKFINKTLEADGKEYALRQKKVDTTFNKVETPAMQSLDETTLVKMLDNTKKLYLTSNPLALFTKEDSPEYTDKKQFLSSDYMLSRLKADPENVYKRLSSGYAEQELVKEQLRQLTNRAKLGTNSDEDTFKHLMDNGIAVAKELELRPGIRLSPEQTAKLTADIVWLEKVNTPKGEILVPKVYISKLHQEDLLRDGSIVLGNDVKIFNDSLENIGTIKATNGLSLQGKTINNLGGNLQSEQLNISTDTLNNLSGNVVATKDLTIKANQLVNETQKTIATSNGVQKNFVHNVANIISKGDIHLEVDNLKSVAGNMVATKELDLKTKNLELSALASKYHVAVSGVKLDTTKYVSSNMQGENVKINAQNITMEGSNVIGDNINIKTNKLSLNNVKDYSFSDVEVGNRGSDYFNRKLVANETNVASNILANNNINLDISKNLTLKASNINSKVGQTNINAGNISIVNDKEHHELLEELHKKDYGFLSSKTIDIYNHQSTDSVVGSNISSGSINLNSGKDILVKASNLVADNDVNLTAKGTVQILSDTEKSASKYVKQVKKSGIFSNGGLSITIGKQKQTDSYDNIITSEKGSTIGSNAGKVNINSNSATEIKASDVLAKRDITVNGSKIDVVNGYNTSTSREKHEFEKSGLTLSLSNDLLNTATDFANTLKQSSEVKDSRLKNLLSYKAIDDAKRSLKKNNLKTQGKSLNLNLSLGAEKYFSNSVVNTKQAKNSNLLADGNIKLTTNKEDINILGSNIAASNISLNSAKNINLQGSEKTTNITSQTKAKSASVGVSYDLVKGGISDINISGNASKGNTKGEDIVHQPAVVKAEKLVDILSKDNFNITDGKVEGNKVVANIGGSLNVQSLQDVHNYSEDSKSAGFGVSFNGKGKNNTDSTNEKPSIFKSTSGSINKTDIDSDYKSVVNQAGIYAGQDGFTINVGDTTKLVGSVLASDTDNNSLKTKNLVMEDIENKAKYSYESRGLSYLNDKRYKESLKYLNDKEIKIISNNELTKEQKETQLKDLENDPIYREHLNYVNSLHNEMGLIPNMLPGEEKEIHSTTKSAIAPGNIDVENPSIDLTNINRDIKSSLNKLDNIFDKQDIQERQETAKLFNKYSNEAIHHIADMAGWEEGSVPKNVLHALIGKVTADMINGNTNIGIAAGALSEALSPEIIKLADGDPAQAQWLSYVLGYATDKILGSNGQQGGSISQYATKWNNLLVSNYSQVPTTMMTGLVGAYMVAYKLQIDNIGRVINSTGEKVFDSYNDLVVYYRWDGKLKRMPKGVIDKLGGEAYTQPLKRQTGKSKSDLYWNPKTGDVYSVPKNGSGDAEWVDKVDVEDKK